MGRRIRLDQHLPDGAARLAQAVHARRDELGLTRDEIKKPSGTTIYSIELERKSQYDSSMLSALEQGLRWKPGSVDRVLRGEEPLPEHDVDPPEQPAAPAPFRPPQPPSETYNHRQERLSRRALYRMMLAMGEMYGPGMIMEVAAEVVSDLQESADLASDSPEQV